MKFYLIAIGALAAALVAVALATDPTQSQAPTSSSPDDSSLKTLKIE